MELARASIDRIAGIWQRMGLAFPRKRSLRPCEASARDADISKKCPRSQRLDKAREKGGAPWSRRRRVAGHRGGLREDKPGLDACAAAGMPSRRTRASRHSTAAVLTAN